MGGERRRGRRGWEGEERGGEGEGGTRGKKGGERGEDKHVHPLTTHTSPVLQDDS